MQAVDVTVALAAVCALMCVWLALPGSQQLLQDKM
jgi:hypothetical protein